MSQRTERIDELLRQEIGEILAREVSDPRIGFATITEVETTPDLRHARVWVSVIGQHGEREETIVALGRAMSFVRRELGRRLRLKRIPELHVRLDDTAERGTRVLQLLHELEEGHLPDEVPPPEESLPTPIARLPRDEDAAVEPAPGEAADGDPAQTDGLRPASASSSDRRRRDWKPKGPSTARGPAGSARRGDGRPRGGSGTGRRKGPR
jgi:ribosome-binding factor A